MTAQELAEFIWNEEGKEVVKENPNFTPIPWSEAEKPLRIAVAQAILDKLFEGSRVMELNESILDEHKNKHPLDITWDDFKKSKVRVIPIKEEELSSPARS